jgi:arginine/lysine/ornithine decarboxylase
VLCDRNCHKSILHSPIMTGATPLFDPSSRNGLGIIGPISKEQFTLLKLLPRRLPQVRSPVKPAAKSV